MITTQVHIPKLLVGRAGSRLLARDFVANHPRWSGGQVVSR
jgi:hypothetical protein